ELRTANSRKEDIVMRIKLLQKLSRKSPVVRNAETPTMLHLQRIGTQAARRLVLSMVVLFALTALVVPAHASPVDINQRAPIALTTLNACTGEIVTVTGE